MLHGRIPAVTNLGGLPFIFDKAKRISTGLRLLLDPPLAGTNTFAPESGQDEEMKRRILV